MDPKWILKGLVESVFVVASILMALAVDEWEQNKDFQDLASQSLAIFEREIRQNRARLADATPYHTGVRDFLGNMRQLPDPPMDVRDVMEGVSPPVLVNTAWETALATGALTHMDFEIVSGLSLTYSIQEGFEDSSRLDRPRFTNSDTMSRDPRLQVQQAYDYVLALVRDEDNLLSVFDQALEMIEKYRNGESLSTISDSSKAKVGS